MNKTIVLLDSVEPIINIEKHFAAEEIKIHYSVFNISSKKLFLLRGIYSFVKEGSFNSIFTALALIFNGRLKFFTNPNSDEYISFIKKENFEIGLHKCGIIYKENLINSFKIGILNSHIGKLPEMRGRSVLEWSIIKKVDTGITSFLIDKGIDTGKNIIFFRKYNKKKFSTLSDMKSFLFAQDMRIYKESLQIISSILKFEKNELSMGSRYYQISSLLNAVAEYKFKSSEQ